MLVCQLLLNDLNIRINEITKKGTALHIACKNLDMDFVKLLLDNNADPQYENVNNFLEPEIIMEIYAQIFVIHKKLSICYSLEQI